MTRLGLLIPSSNIVLEPLAAKLQAQDQTLTIHISRLGVLDVKLDDTSRAQFEMDKQIEAAKLLCDAKVDRIIWGGTSASWLGVSHDQAFVQRLTQETGIPTTTCVLEINRRLKELSAKRIGMVTPYTDDVADQINRNYQDLEFEVAAFENDGGQISNDFASITPQTIEHMIRNVAQADVDAIIIMCTNVAGASVAAKLEQELSIPILDSAAITLLNQ